MRVVKVQGDDCQHRITIPKKIANKFKLEKGSEIAVFDNDDCIILIPIDRLKKSILLGGSDGTQ